MNYKMIINVIGRVLVIEACLMLLPLIVGFIALENSYLSFLIPILCLLAVGIPLLFIKPHNKSISAKEGFVIVALAWIIMSLVGAVPFVISGAITNYLDAFFETVSGFTTTGASILGAEQYANFGKATMFWRLFTHWIGGMGVLVFILAILPKHDSGIMHVFRAESPGPSVSKFVSKLKFTARILYGIYIGLTVMLMVMLLCGGMPFYDSVLYSFSVAGTGGFGITSAGISLYNSVYLEMVIAVFMFLFGINFNMFYLVLIGDFKKIFKSEELRLYFILVVVATFAIAINILSLGYNFGESMRYAFFQVASITSTTGLSSIDYNYFPWLSKSILLFLTITGACAGSTCGGMKLSRVALLGKSAIIDIKKMANPRVVVPLKFEGRVVGKEMLRNTRAYLTLWLFLVIVTVIILSFDVFDFTTNLTSALACIGNVGPGLEAVGPAGNYAGFSAVSKIWLSFIMLCGRLEIFPILMLFRIKTWKR